MIHYHGTPISGGTQAQMALRNRHIMVSFATASQAEMLIELCSTFTVDNGAYSAWKSGKKFDLEGYAQFVERWCRHPGFDWCVMPAPSQMPTARTAHARSFDIFGAPIGECR